MSIASTQTTYKPRSATGMNSAWYRIYFAALLEADHDRALIKMGNAQKVMRNRLLELRRSPPQDPGELQDLDSGMTYLALLVALR